MYIKKVVLDGFKSYAQRTEISGFDPLFNAITGLNGSGKSNILDAICFLLGISNLTQVRAGSLQELVYKGGQAGITKATVTITFDNHDKKQSPLGYESYDEITVSRQIVIGGRNKYLINGSNATPSRVQDLFRSVQLNINNPHFLIMQGRITKVLNMKPPEILSMIEEAAGTRMYESKRASAQKTIEKKDNKLKEIEVILAEEITPTLRRLKEERSSYLEYQKIMREVEHLSRLSVAFQFVQAETCRQESDVELESLRVKVGELEAQIEEADKQLVENLAHTARLEKERDAEAHGPIQELEKKVDEAAKAKAVAEATMKHSKDTLAAEKKNHKALQKSLEEDCALLQIKEAEMSKGRGVYEELKARREAAEKAVVAAQKHFQAVSAGLSSGAGGQEETLAAQKIACENAVSAAVTEAKQAEMRLKSAQGELREKEKASKSSEQAYNKDKTIYDNARKEVDRIEQMMSKLSYQEGKEEELQAKRDSLAADINRLRSQVDMLESRIPQVQFSYQDPYKGFKKDKVKGPVAKLVQVKDVSTATALEVAAGGKLFNIVVDTEETAKDLLNKGRLKRRYTIIPLNKISANALSSDVIKKAQALVGKSKAMPALSLVGYEDELRPAMEYVFGSSFICDTIESAKKVAFDKQVLKRSVTLTGDDFNPSGTLTGGSRSRASSVLTQLQELCEAEARLQESVAALTQVQQQLDNIQAEASKYRKMKDQLEAKSHEAAMIMTRLEQSTHHQQLTLVQELKDTIEEQKEVVQKAKETEKAARDRLTDIQQKMKDSKRHHEQELKAAEKEMTRARKEAENVVGAAGLQEQDMHTLELEVEELRTAINIQQQQIEVCNGNISKKTEELEEHTKAESEAKSTLQEAKKSLDEYKAILRERTKELQRYEQQRKQLEKKKTTCSIEIKEVGHNIDNVQKDGRDATHKVEVMLTKYEWIATDKQFFGQPNSAYDFEAADMKEVSRRLAKMQEQKEKLSKSVNMRAMNMLGKAEEKYNDLLRKKTIVENDKAKIAELIKELDQKKNEALESAHERVNKDFGSIFSTLLPGTSAKLSPPEGQTVLDGLEVKVAFSGVWKESLQELSGGQRSLVALSLILALLLFKPAPVYILDEVDAALDLSHTQNIGHMLRSHFKHSQFIVVSLKDGMFNNANVLFKTKFVDGVSTVTRYVNPKLQAAAPADVDVGGASDMQSLRKKAIAGSHRSKKARLHS